MIQKRRILIGGMVSVATGVLCGAIAAATYHVQAAVIGAIVGGMVGLLLAAPSMVLAGLATSPSIFFVFVPAPVIMLTSLYSVIYEPVVVLCLAAATYLVSLTGVCFISRKKSLAPYSSCASCGYSLLGLKKGVCPECGRDSACAERAEAKAHRRIRLPISIAAIALLSVMAVVFGYLPMIRLDLAILPVRPMLASVERSLEENIAARDIEVRRLAQRQLYHMGPQATKDLFFSSTEEKVRSAAIEVLGWYRDEAHVELFLVALGDADEKVRFRALLALQHLPYCQYKEAIGRMTNDPSYRVTRWASDMVAACGETEHD